MTPISKSGNREPNARQSRDLELSRALAYCRLRGKEITGKTEREVRVKIALWLLFGDDVILADGAEKLPCSCS